jgi:hypothetical protein
MKTVPACSVRIEAPPAQAEKRLFSESGRLHGLLNQAVQPEYIRLPIRQN